MAQLQLTEQRNPLAQTFRVTEPGGSVITGVGIFFATAPTAADRQIPITLELRPVEGGTPSSSMYFDGTRVSASAAQIRAVASTTFASGTEYKFTFDTPVFVPDNTEVAAVLYTNAQSGHYKAWNGTVGQHLAGSTTKLITKQLNSGALYKSANGTAWTPDQFSDLAFKVYRAVFDNIGNIAVLDAAQPGIKRLTENTTLDDLVEYPSNPLQFTANSNKLKVIHPNHGFQNGDKVELSSIKDSSLDSSSTISGVKGASFLGTRTVDSADPWGYSITMDSTADSTIRGGLDVMAATEQYLLDTLNIYIPTVAPKHTEAWYGGDFTTSKSFAGNETAYSATNNVALKPEESFTFFNPQVVMSDANETLRLSGAESTKIKVGLITNNKYVAPFINADNAALGITSNFIDFQESDGYVGINRNKLTTIDYVAETEPGQGTTLSKHITIPYQLDETATSIRVYVDAIRPPNSDFVVWFRTSKSTSEVPIDEENWTAFSRTMDPPNTSNYTDIGASFDMREYNFNVYDIPDFDRYQIKITMSTTKSTYVPIFTNLRTIATV